MKENILLLFFIPIQYLIEIFIFIKNYFTNPYFYSVNDIYNPHLTFIKQNQMMNICQELQPDSCPYFQI